MFGFNMRGRQTSPNSTATSPKTPLMNNNGTSPTKAQVDTSTPFRSVKAAIGLFGDRSPMIGNDSHKRSKSTVDERVLEKESHHHTAIKELESLREQLRSIETSKDQALKDLDKAKYTLDQLTTKLDAICESKQAAIAAAEEAKKTLEQLEEDRKSNNGETHVDKVTNQYKECSDEISSVKQQITSLKQDFDAALEAKLAALKEVDEAQHVIQEKQQKETKLSEEVSNMQRELNEVTKPINHQARDEHDKLMAEKQARIQSCKASKEEIENQIRAWTEGSGLNGDENSKEKLEATNEAITLITERLNTVRASDMEELNNITSELEKAKKDLQQLGSEQNSLTSLVDSLKQRKEVNATFISQAEELKKQAELYKQEAQEARIATEETEKKLHIALSEAKEAKAALNLDSIIKLTVEEFDELKKKDESSTDLEASTANGQVETIKENEKTVLQKIEECQKENERLKIAIEDAKKQTEMADAARAMVEGELRKLHDKQ